MPDRTRITLTTLHILLALSEGPRHGYSIGIAVEERSAGRVRLGAGTLYEALQRLLASGWIEEVDTPAEVGTAGGPPRRFYALTAPGRDVLGRELRTLDDLVRYARSQALFDG